MREVEASPLVADDEADALLCRENLIFVHDVAGFQVLLVVVGALDVVQASDYAV